MRYLEGASTKHPQPALGPDWFSVVSIVIELMPTSTEESLHSDERLRTHRFRVKGPPKLLVEVEEELPCEYWLERVLYDEEARS